MDKQTKEDIKKLKKEKRYDEIYFTYGAEIYQKNTPSRTQKKQIKRLLSEGKYQDIYNKFGEKAYNKTLIKAMYTEIKENRGTARATLWRMKKNLINVIKKTFATASAIVMVGPPTIAVMMADHLQDAYEKNGVTYAKEIKDYNDKITQYAEKVQDMNLTDVQIYMKVMDDMWENIKGYGEPEKDITGYPELDLATEDGYGVCRNMASDVAQKLNAINPDYNARTLVVKTGHEGKYTMANIERKYVQKNENNNDEKQDKQENVLDKIIDVIAGNHLVTLVDVPQDNLILVLDPTNPGIGIYNNGKITMLNSDKDNGVKFEPKEYVSSFMLESGGTENIVSVIEDYGKSFKKPKLTLNEIEDKYGLQAQNEALEYTREHTNTTKEDFKETLKVDGTIGVQNTITKQDKIQNKDKKISQGEVR